MKKIIIGIHGLGTKPPKMLLKRWWRKAIEEGLERISKPAHTVPFEMVYWADIVHEKSEKPWIRNKDNPLYLDEPYRKAAASAVKKDKPFRSKVYKYLETQLDKIFLNKDFSLNLEGVTDKILSRYFQDLNLYYSGGPEVRQAIQNRLLKVLESHKDNEILLICHSMGSIIAYDVLTGAGKDYRIQTLVTIGSPLGLPVVVGRIFAAQKQADPETALPRAPENVLNSWFNLSDTEDNVALDHTLYDDYAANSSGVRAQDIDVYNDYKMNGLRNPHKCYGYLRTPELADIINTFLEREAARGIYKSFLNIFSRLKQPFVNTFLQQ